MSSDDAPNFAEPKETVATLRERRILIAEDDPTTMAVAMAQLKKLGYRAHAVANGAEAVELLESREYDLVLMDCEMPIMDGYEATRRIRLSRRPDIPVIAVTAYVLPGDLEKCTRAGMNGFLPKPLNPTRLAAMLAKWCPQTAHRSPSGIVEPVALKPEAAVFDSVSLLNRLMGDRPLAETILTGFLEDFPSQLRNLRERFAEGDSRGARLAAHALKGSSATVSANRLSELARELEVAAQATELDEFGELLPKAVGEFERLKGALKKIGWSLNHAS
jgi:CheY-like chemotaxis protein